MVSSRARPSSVMRPGATRMQCDFCAPRPTRPRSWCNCARPKRSACSTTVIEVGVDVPNASVMVVEHAERFGLAQLHQLRGRVGRGAAKSYCILMTGPRVSDQGEERLNAMVRTQDGFELAELDLTMRGPGEFLGTRQAGLPEFRVANLVRDRQLLELAKLEAERFANSAAAEGSETERARVWARLKEAWQRRYGLVEAG